MTTRRSRAADTPTETVGVTGGLLFTVHGQPAPQGSKTRTRYGMRDDNATTLKPWREAVKWAAIHAIEDAAAEPAPAGVPLYVDIAVTLPKPATAPKRKQIWPVKPRSGDVDKLARACLDALTDAGVWHDDAQVLELIIHKTYPNEHPNSLPHPGAVIYVQRIREGDNRRRCRTCGQWMFPPQHSCQDVS